MDATDPRSDRWAADVVLADGSTTHVRPIVPEDGEAILAFHERQSRESIYFRFFSPRPRLSEEDVRHLTTVDGDRRMAFVADRDGELIGIARYDRYGDQPLAEVAFFTDDEHHGRGIATLLLEYLAAYAREVGISRFEAHVLPSNRRMVRVFTQAGFEASSEFADGVIEVTLEIEPTDSATEAIAERARAAERQAVVRLLEPRSIAVIGAGRDPNGIGRRVLGNLLDGPFAGPVYPVHTEAHSIAGVRAYTTVQEIPDEVDLAMICVPADDVVAVIEDCGRARVDVAAVITAGFAESGPDGAAEQDRVVAAARRFGVRVLGPNCLGVINNDPAVAMHATFADVDVLAGRVGLLSQSGTLGAVILDRARAKGVGISSFVAVGNKADLSGNDLLQYWQDDDRTDVVLLYLESFGNPRRFGRNVRQVALTKPVFAVRSGAATAQDASLDDATIDALLRQTGVIRVPTISALLDAALVASHQPIPAGPRTAVVGNSGGSASMAADACVDAGLELAVLAPETMATIDAERLHGRPGTNPVDLRYDAAGDQYAPVLDAVLVDPGVDVVLFVHAPYDRDDEDRIVAVLDHAASNHPDVTIVACIYGPHRAVTPGGVPIFDFPDEAAHAVGSAVRHRRWLDAQAGGVVLAVEDPAAVSAQARSLLGGARRRRLDPMSARRLITAGDVDIVPALVADDLVGLHRLVADGFDFGVDASGDSVPVALKAVNHPAGATTRQGGVALDLHDGSDVADAAEVIAEHLGQEAWPMLIQPMVRSGTDVRIAVETHSVVGPVIRLGPGGGASRFAAAPRRVLPLDDVGARQLVAASGLAELLSPAETDQVIGLARRLAAVVDAAPEIVELVCNPVIVRDDAADIVEVDVTLEAVRADARPPVRRVDQTG